MNQTITPRLLNLKNLMAYTGMGRHSAKSLARQANAEVRYISILLYDREKIDSYIEQLGKESET